MPATTTTTPTRLPSIPASCDLSLRCQRCCPLWRTAASISRCRRKYGSSFPMRCTLPLVKVLRRASTCATPTLARQRNATHPRSGLRCIPCRHTMRWSCPLLYPCSLCRRWLLAPCWFIPPSPPSPPPLSSTAMYDYCTSAQHWKLFSRVAVRHQIPLYK